MSTLVNAETSTKVPLPPGLQLSKECKPHSFWPSLRDLEEISKNNFTDKEFNNGGEGCNLSGFWSHFDWWGYVATELREELRGSNRAFSVDLLGYENKLREAVARTVEAWPDAFLSPIHLPAHLATDDASSQMELFKRYYAFTRFVCATAEKMYPGYDLAWLTSQA